MLSASWIYIYFTRAWTLHALTSLGRTSFAVAFASASTANSPAAFQTCPLLARILPVPLQAILDSSSTIRERHTSRY